MIGRMVRTVWRIGDTCADDGVPTAHAPNMHRRCTLVVTSAEARVYLDMDRDMPTPVITSLCVECDIEPATHHRNDVPLCDECGDPTQADERVAPLAVTEPTPEPFTTPGACDECHEQGWFPANHDSEIQRCDACGVFSNDDEAIAAALRSAADVFANPALPREGERFRKIVVALVVAAERLQDGADENDVETLLATDPDDAVLVARIGQGAPEGYWPNGDREAFKTALGAYAVTDFGMVDDLDEPLAPDDPDYGYSRAKYQSDLIISEV